MIKTGLIFEDELNKLEVRVLQRLSELMAMNVGLKFVEDLEQAREDQEFGDLLEYRNEITGNVFDFYPISITEDQQIEAYTIEGVPLQGDPVSIKQLGVEDRIALINLIEENGRA
jgi:hypothetical protein